MAKCSFKVRSYANWKFCFAAFYVFWNKINLKVYNIFSLGFYIFLFNVSVRYLFSNFFVGVVTFAWLPRDWLKKKISQG